MVYGPHRRGGGLFHIAFAARQGEAAKGAHGLDIDHRDVGALFGLIGGDQHVAGGLGFQDEHAHAGLDHRAAAVLTVDQHRMVGGDGTDDLGPAHLATAALLHPAANRLEHHIARVEHIALVTVIKGQRAEGPLHDHLAEAHGARLEGDVGDPVHRHAGRNFEPETGVAGDRQEALAHGAHVGGQLGLE